MGDLEKNDAIFWKISFQMFCKQIYQILHCKYENDDSHLCKYLPIFISFTIDNLVDTILVCCMFYRLTSFKISILHQRFYFTTVNTKSIVLFTVNTYQCSWVLPLIILLVTCLVWCMFYHVNFSEFVFFINDPISRL